MNKPKKPPKKLPKKNSPAARSKARRFVLQALYQMKLTGMSAGDVERQFRQDHDMKRVDTEYLHQILSNINLIRGDLTDVIALKIDRKFDELDPVEAAVLYIGCYELIHRIDIPYRVAINESVELAKQFGAAESHRLVNSVLDSIAAEYRASEYNRR